MAAFSARGCLPVDRTWDPVTGGESGALVFRSEDGRLHAKCVPAEASGALRAERDRIDWLATQGVPGPAVADWSAGERGACLVTTTVPGVPAGALSPAGLLEAWPSIVGLVRRLHDLPVAACPFDHRLATMFPMAEDVVARDAVRQEWLRPEQRGRPAAHLLAELRSELPQRLDQEEADLAVCHGDACMPNFLVQPETSTCTGLIDLGRLGRADRHADLALLWSSASDRWAEAEVAKARPILAEGYGPGLVDDERLRFYVHLDPLTW